MDSVGNWEWEYKIALDYIIICFKGDLVGCYYILNVCGDFTLKSFIELLRK